MFPPETKILIIDDMAAVRDIVRKTLQNMGFKSIVDSIDGESGWNTLVAHKNDGKPFDLVISDWNMPKLKGIDLLKKVRASDEFGKVPFVLLTSESERDQVTEAVMAGVSQYIVKPFTMQMFTDKLKAAHAKHSKA